jgi:hypothetical protein
MYRRHRAFYLATLLFTAVVAHAATENSVIIPRVENAPTIDGKLDDPCWAKAAVITSFGKPGNIPDARAAKPIEARLCTDGAALFIGIKLNEPDFSKIHAQQTIRNENVWTDDCAEVWIRTTTNSMDIDQFLVNSIGTQGEQRQRSGVHQDWKPAWTVKTSKGADCWIVEMKIPAADLNLDGFHSGMLLGLRIGREDYASSPGDFATWPAGAPYSGFEGLGRAFIESSNCIASPALEVLKPWSIGPDDAKCFESAQDGDTKVIRIHSPNRYCAMSQELKLQPSSTYRLSADIKASGPMYVRVRAPQTDKRIDERIDLSADKSDTFAPYSKRFISGPDGKGLIVVGVTEASGTGDFSVRNLRVERDDEQLDTGKGIPVKAGADPLVVTKLIVTDCRALKGFIGAPVDGTLKSGQWDGAYWEYNQPGCGAGVGYDYHNNDGLHITFADKDGFNFGVVRGGIKAKLYRDCAKYDSPDGGTKVAEFPGHTQNSRLWLPETVKTGKVSFFNVSDGVIGDCSFFRVSTGSESLKSMPLMFCVNGKPAEMDAVTKAQLAERFDASQRTAYAAVEGEEAPNPLELTAGKAIHFISIPLKEETPLAAIELDTTVDGAGTNIPFTIRIQDPLNPRLELHGADYELDKAGDLKVVCHFPAQIVPKDTRLWVTVRFDRPVKLVAPSLVLHSISRERAFHQALEHRKFLLRNFYGVMSEARPWMAFNKQEDIDKMMASNSPSKPWVKEILDTLDQCRAIDKDGTDSVVRQYYEWIYHTILRKTGKLAEFPTKFDHIDGVPEWASLVHQAWMQVREVPKWWIENRMVENGELGGQVNDDTDMFGNYACFPLFERDGIGGLCLESGAKLAAYAEQNNLEQGLNKNTMDALHAYEEGVNHESYMLWWFYGDPVYFERCLNAARSVEQITMLTPQGHRHFKSIEEIGLADLHMQRKIALDGEFTHLFMHPVLEVAWYTHHPRVIKMLKEWADGWLNHYAHAAPGEYPKMIDPATDSVKQTDTYPFPGCWGGEGSTYTFLADITGDSKYVKPYVDFLALKKENNVGPHLPELISMGCFKNPAQEIPDAISRNWTAALYTSGDTAPFVAAIKKDIEELQRFPHMYTTVECFTDRVFLYALINPAIAYTGGFATRNKVNQTCAISWEGLGTDFAALVTHHDATSLKVLVCNITDKPIKGQARIWRLDHGDYEVTFSEEDKPSSAQKMTLARGDTIPIDMPKKGVWTLNVVQTRALEPIFDRADLAVSPLDTSAANGKIIGKVHNIGLKDVDDVIVALLDATGKTVATKHLGKLAAPLDLVPKTVPFEFDQIPANPKGWSVVVDPDRKVPEIFKGNNRVGF